MAQSKNQEQTHPEGINQHLESGDEGNLFQTLHATHLHTSMDVVDGTRS